MLRIDNNRKNVKSYVFSSYIEYKCFLNDAKCVGDVIILRHSYRPLGQHAQPFGKVYAIQGVDNTMFTKGLNSKGGVNTFDDVLWGYVVDVLM